MLSPKDEHKILERVNNIEEQAYFTIFEKYIVQELRGPAKLIEIDSTDQEGIMRAKYINEKFEEQSDPIEDMGIGVMPVVRKELENINDMYGSGEKIELVRNDTECGYSVAIYFGKTQNGKHIGATYSITYDYERGWIASFEDGYEPYMNADECESLEVCLDKIIAWINYNHDKLDDSYGF